MRFRCPSHSLFSAGCAKDVQSQRVLRGGSPGPGWNAVGGGAGTVASAEVQPQGITGARKGMLDALVAYLAHLSSNDTSSAPPPGIVRRRGGELSGTSFRVALGNRLPSRMAPGEVPSRHTAAHHVQPLNFGICTLASYDVWASAQMLWACKEERTQLGSCSWCDAADRSAGLLRNRSGRQLCTTSMLPSGVAAASERHRIAAQGSSCVRRESASSRPPGCTQPLLALWWLPVWSAAKPRKAPPSRGGPRT